MTNDEPGVDYGKIAGKAVGGGLTQPLPTGTSGPASKGMSNQGGHSSGV